MELDLLEKVKKDMEEKESHQIKVISVVTYTYGNKGKDPMEYLPRVTVSQQLKALMHTSQQSKQKLAQITSVLDNQVAATVKPISSIQATTIVTQVSDEQVPIDIKPFEKQRIQVNVYQIPTIDLIDYDA